MNASSTSQERQSRFEKFKKEINDACQSNEDLKPNSVREMTASVASRWYRAPEIVLTEEYG